MARFFCSLLSSSSFYSFAAFYWGKSLFCTETKARLCALVYSEQDAQAACFTMGSHCFQRLGEWKMQFRNVCVVGCCLSLMLSGAAVAAGSETEQAQNQAESQNQSSSAALDQALLNFKESADLLVGELKNSSQSTWEQTRKSAEEVLKSTSESFNTTWNSTSQKVADSTAETLNYLAQAGREFAQSIKGKSVKEQKAIVNLDATLRQMNAFYAQFNQEVYSDNGEVLARSSGNVALQRPSLFVMNTLDPDKLVLYIQDGDIYYYDEAVNQVSIYSMDNLKDNPFLLLIEQQNSVWDDFTVSQDADRYSLVPKESQDIRSLTLAFAPYTLKDKEGSPRRVLESITIRMNDGNTNFYRFFSHKVDVDAKLFNVELPSDVDYNDERK